ncbi:MAG: hypothetical protein Q9168_003607 [Polycauliona sp. 1 TL-2023]
MSDSSELPNPHQKAPLKLPTRIDAAVPRLRDDLSWERWTLASAGTTFWQSLEMVGVGGKVTAAGLGRVNEVRERKIKHWVKGGGRESMMAGSLQLLRYPVPGNLGALRGLLLGRLAGEAKAELLRQKHRHEHAFTSSRLYEQKQITTLDSFQWSLQPFKTEKMESAAQHAQPEKPRRDRS